MKRDRDNNYHLLSTKTKPSKRQKIDQNTSKLINHQYHIMYNTNNNQQNNKQSTNLKQITNIKNFKYEPHPTQPNKQIISLISSDDEESSLSSSSSSSSSLSSKEESSSLSTTQEGNIKYEKDSKGYLVFVQGLIILNKYKLHKQLGKGTFSKVFECYQIDKKNKKEKYAIKVIRNVYKYQMAAKTELKVLKTIKNKDPFNKSCCIHIINDDQYKGHPIFLFPLLGKSIYSFMVNNKYKPFCYKDIIHLMFQILTGVNYIHSLGIIITDLKPENIVFVNDEIDRDRIGVDSNLYSSPKSTKIKLIDFGSAVIDENGDKHSHLIQTRHYRAPEVVFKLNWSFSADIWSIGCILVELIYGKMLFNTHCSIDHLNQMVKCIDAPPTNLLQLIDDDTWNEYFDSRGALNMYKAKRSPVQCTKLENYFAKHIDSDINYKKLYHLAVNLLCWDPVNRLSAKQALNHELFVNISFDSFVNK